MKLTFNGTDVAKVNDQKHLGITLDSTLSFDKHLNEKVIKAKKNVGMLKHLSNFLPLKTLDQIYKSVVCPRLDYCDIIYHNLSYVLKFSNGKSRKNSISSSPCNFWCLARF